MNLFKKISTSFRTDKLFYAIVNSASLPVIDGLINKGVNLSATAAVERATPLHGAAVHCSPAVIQRLIDAGADVNAGDIMWRTPVIYAIKSNKIENIKVFFENGAQDDDALNTAIKTKNVNTVKKVLTYGKYCKNEALSKAVAWLDVAAVELLLEAGADPSKIEPVEIMVYSGGCAYFVKSDDKERLKALWTKLGNGGGDNGGGGIYTGEETQKKKKVEELLEKHLKRRWRGERIVYGD